MWSRVGDDDLSNDTDIITVTTMSDMYTVTSSLFINSTNRSRDEGAYTCTASNGVANNNIGVVNAQSGELVIQGRSP